jgi:hypothetical protein
MMCLNCGAAIEVAEEEAVRKLQQNTTNNNK